MAANSPEEYIDLKAALEETTALLALLREQEGQLKVLLSSQHSPSLESIVRVVQTLKYLLRLECSIISIDLAAIDRYQQPDKDRTATQLAIGALLSSYGMKRPMHWRILEMHHTVFSKEAFVNALSREGQELKQLAQEVMREAKARQDDYYELLQTVKRPFDEQHIKEFTAINTYRLPVEIDFTSLRQTTTDIVVVMHPVHQLARLAMAINAKTIAPLIAPKPLGN